jgi:CRISPR-associated protein Cmr2
MKHLLAISLGPVQGFIAAARKTRDLWFGSFLLSDIARKTAKSIVEQPNVTLIFPGVDDTNKLSDENFSVANVILAVVENPQEVAKLADETAKNVWRKYVDDAKNEVEKIGGKNVLRNDVWQRQRDDFVEFYAAWVPYQDGQYQENRKRVMRLLAGRKACRNFAQEIQTDDRLPKSSLDGARDTVLQKDLPKPFRDNLHIREGEQLDVVGVVKRFCGGRKKFPSLGEIAVNPVCKNRKEGFTPESEIDDDTDKRLQKLAEKSPYLAVICADGDKMGQVISSLKTPQEHQQFSIALSDFSQAVPNLVKQHYGECVYVGGDDVLAFVPVDTVLDCARALSETFSNCLKKYNGVSLSVGVAIGHYHEMLENLLDFARKAESDAKKPERNGLAIWMYHRGNSLCSVKQQWTNELDKRINRWANLFAEQKIPQKFPYDLRSLADLYDKSEVPADCLQKQLIATASHKRVYATELYREFEKIKDVPTMEKLVNELLIAQMIGDVKDKAKKG